MVLSSSSSVISSHRNDYNLKCKVVRILDEANIDEAIEKKGQIRMNKRKRVKKVLKASDNDMYIRGTAFHKSFKHIYNLSYDNIKEIIKSEKVPNMFIIEKYNPTFEKVGLIFETKENMDFFEKIVSGKRPDLNLILPTYYENKKYLPKFKDLTDEEIHQDSHYEVKNSDEKFFDDVGKKVDNFMLDHFVDDIIFQASSRNENDDGFDDQNLHKIASPLSSTLIVQRNSSNNQQHALPENIPLSVTPEAEYRDSTHHSINNSTMKDKYIEDEKKEEKTFNSFYTKSGIFVRRDFEKEPEAEVFQEKVIIVKPKGSDRFKEKISPESNNNSYLQESAPYVSESDGKRIIHSSDHHYVQESAPIERANFSEAYLEGSSSVSHLQEPVSSQLSYNTIPKPMLVNSTTQISNSHPRVMQPSNSTPKLDNMNLNPSSNQIRIDESGWVYLYADINKKR